MSTEWKDPAHNITLNTQFNFESGFEAERLYLQRNLHTLYIYIYIIYRDTAYTIYMFFTLELEDGVQDKIGFSLIQPQ